MYGRTESMEPSIFLREIDRNGLRVIGSIPRGFGSSETPRHSALYTEYYRKPLKSSDGRWALGDRVFHDDHGYGSIAQIREGDDGPLVKVVFETGHELRFLSLHQSSRFTKIRD
jgi:DNA helicase-2/ATP-dependent DNA helicase PcrA